MRAQGLTKETITSLGMKNNAFPHFDVGDTIAVTQRIKEGDKERLQVFQGDVVAIRKLGASSTFTVRKIGAHGVPVERIFPYYTPLIKSIKALKKGDVRRAKLYYLRDRVGRAARVKEKILTREQKEQKALDKAGQNAQEAPAVSTPETNQAKETKE